MLYWTGEAGMKFQLIIFFSIMTIIGFGQEVKKEKISKNTVFAEFNYNSNLDLYSILYDRMFKANGIIKIGMQSWLTFSTEIETGDKGYAVFFPLKVYVLVGKNKHNFEAGLGFKLLGFVFPEFNIGYRFKPKTNGISLRAGYSGIILPGGLQNMISVSVGYTF